MAGLDGFESTKGGAVWEPKQTGKGDDRKDLDVTGQSYLIGWYLGAKTGIGANDSTLHEFRMQEVGDEAHLIGDVDENTKKVSIWGTGVLDSMIADSIAPGQGVAIVWKGKQKPKNGTGKPYHIWDVMINPSMEPIQVGGPANNIPDSGPSDMNLEQSEGRGNRVATTETAEDDDLPF